MYHVYNRNSLVCIIPSIVTVTLFGEFVYLVSLTHFPSSLNCDFLAIGCGEANLFLHPPAVPFLKKSVGGWTISSFCLTILQVPTHLVNLQETTLTQNFLYSAIPFT